MDFESCKAAHNSYVVIQPPAKLITARIQQHLGNVCTMSMYTNKYTKYKTCTYMYIEVYGSMW